MHMKKLVKNAALVMAITALSMSMAACESKDTKNDTASSEATETPTITDEATATAEASADSSVKGADYQVAPPKKGDTVVTIDYKNFGKVKIKMFPEEAPKAVENFTTHAKDGYYDGITMHRIINNFMIQGGDPDGTGTGGESIWGTEFENEIVDYLIPIRGSLCMANAGPDTNGSQFFITQSSDTNTIDYPGLTETQTKLIEQNGGCPWLIGNYTVFGQVYEGMDVVDAIAQVEVDASDAPTEKVIISSITVDTYQG